MKKKLESELVTIAHRILKLEGKGDIIKMHTEVSQLFEKLSVLKFAYENFDAENDAPTIGSDTSFFETIDGAFNNKISDTIEVEDKLYINLDEIEDDHITEPLMETIKDMVAQMPRETQEIDTIFEEAVPKRKYNETDFEDIVSGFKNMPIFEPVTRNQNKASIEKKSLNDKLKGGGFNIGLNDKLAFIKHLFDGKSEDYERVMSQLNSFDSFIDAQDFLINIVKPDYNNWKNKEETEERFLEILESRFS